jgi:hypothetical protein
MILTLIFLGMIVLGIVFIKIGDRQCDTLGTLSLGIGSMFLFVSVIIIASNHIKASKVVYENKLKYESLCKRCEIIKSEYEDVSKSDLIEDINEWNIEVYDTKYWTNNPWTNWFHSKKIADNLEYIYWDDATESEE